MNYQAGKIYKIISDEGNDIYIGSTKQKKLCDRLATHKYKYKKWKLTKKDYCSSYELFEKYGVDKCKIILIELFPCNSVEELRSREEYYRLNNNCVNKYRCISTDEERKQHIKEYNIKFKPKRKEYNKINSDKIKEQRRIYRETHKEEIKAQSKIYRELNKDKLKESYQNNKDKIKEQHKIYRDLNKDKLKEYNKNRKNKKIIL